MAIKHVIIHQVKRDKDGEPVTSNLRGDENSTAGLTQKLTDDLGGWHKIINQPRWSMRPSSALCEGLHRLTMRPFAHLKDDPLSGAILINYFFPDALIALFSNAT
jgi:hypothetical protein